MKRWICLFLAAVVAATALSGCGAESRFNEKCKAAGGHQYGTGLKLCLTNDGRVLEIYP